MRRFLALLWLTACSHHIESPMRDAVVDRFSTQFHRCVPLGWVPAAVDGSYVPSYSFDFSPRTTWLRAMWVGWIPNRAQYTAAGRSESRLLNALARKGLLEVQLARSGTWYRLKWSAFSYYFEGNNFGNNPLHLSYLCYSRIVPDVVTVNAGRNVRFTWHSETDAAWADDPIVQRYSVNLAPTRSPATVEVAKRAGSWMVTRASYDVTNTLRDPSAW